MLFSCPKMYLSVLSVLNTDHLSRTECVWNWPLIRIDQNVRKKTILRYFIYIHPQFQCKICRKTFASRSNLSAHSKIQHSETRPQFICLNCGKPCTTPYTLIAHMETKHQISITKETAKSNRHDVKVTEKCKYDTGNFIIIFSCYIFNYFIIYFSVRLYLENKSANKRKRKTVICTQCGISFQGMGNLNKHRKKFHPGKLKNKLYK